MFLLTLHYVLCIDVSIYISLILKLVLYFKIVLASLTEKFFAYREYR